MQPLRKHSKLYTMYVLQVNTVQGIFLNPLLLIETTQILNVYFSAVNITLCEASSTCVCNIL